MCNLMLVLTLWYDSASDVTNIPNILVRRGLPDICFRLLHGPTTDAYFNLLFNIYNTFAFTGIIPCFCSDCHGMHCRQFLVFPLLCAFAVELPLFSQ